LAIDSPNRQVTQAVRYTQPEHVLELTSSEIVDLVTLAGFGKINVSGIWSCRSAARSSGPWLDLAIPADAAQRDARCARADEDPEGSFIWWLVAEKVGPVSPDLGVRVDDIFMRDYPGFVQSRFSSEVGVLWCTTGTGSILSLSRAEQGYAQYGPYVPLIAGEYSASFRYRSLSPGGSLVFDVVTRQGDVLHARKEVPMDRGARVNGWQEVELAFSIDEYVTGLECRVLSTGVDAQLRFGCEVLRVS
jgi:hypothetical protein